MGDWQHSEEISIIKGDPRSVACGGEKLKSGNGVLVNNR